MTSSSGVENSSESDPASIAAEPTSPYDSAPADEDVLCPLCYYNLRGAVENRCPECGYRFQWRDLRDPERRRHPYLFEHHPRRNLWSLRRTFIGALRPRRFWRELRPEQPSIVCRLVIYWFVTNLFALALPLAIVGLDMARLAMFNQGNRVAQAGLTFGASQAWLNAMHPLPPSPAFFRQYFSSLEGEFIAVLLVISAMYLAWPWLTFLALNVFQISMLRARINASHVLHCVVYTFDAMSLLCWGLLLAAGITVAATELIAAPGRVYSPDERLVIWLGMAWVMIALACFIFRLSVAYGLYLKFHRPVLSAVASQILVGLFVFTVVLWIMVLSF